MAYAATGMCRRYRSVCADHRAIVVVDPRFDQANLVMVYLLGVVIIALFYGRWPSVLAAVINVASFDLFLSNRTGH